MQSLCHVYMQEKQHQSINVVASIYNKVKFVKHFDIYMLTGLLKLNGDSTSIGLVSSIFNIHYVSAFG